MELLSNFHPFFFIAVVAELQIMPDVPIALVQLSRPASSSVLAITYNQLYTINSWSVNPGDIC